MLNYRVIMFYTNKSKLYSYYSSVLSRINSVYSFLKLLSYYYPKYFIVVYKSHVFIILWVSLNTQINETVKLSESILTN
jgi:hypothetical protein